MKRVSILSNFIIKIKEFMQGRNGIDKLTYGILAVYCVLSAVKIFFIGNKWGTVITSVLQFLVIGYGVFRVMSKNLQKRYNENFKFEQFLTAWKPYFGHLKLRITYFRTHRFRTCKNCGEFLRLKRIRGKRNITCPKCGKELSFFILF